jgi:peptidoglycan DL-endopeptidase LytE
MKGCTISKYCLTAIAALFLFIVSIDSASAEKIYTVKKGDNVSRISKKFRITPEQLRDANDLDSNKLSVGHKLVIPSGTTARTAPAAETEPAAEKDRGDQAPGTGNSDDLKKIEVGYRYHKVQSGETLASIAKKHGISTNELRAINDLRKKKIRPGQNLIVGNTYDSDDSPGTKSRKIMRIDISGKIDQVKALSGSPELSAMSVNERLLLFAQKLLDIPYKFGANGVFGLDCSSYVQQVYGLIDMQLPRSAREQFKVGEKISKDELRSGDLIFFRTYARFPSHVGIYIGDNLFIHASSLSKKVRIDSLDQPFYVKRFIGAKRLLPDPVTSLETPEIKVPQMPSN